MGGRQLGPGSTPAATVQAAWQPLVDAYLTEKRLRSGSERTAGEYGRYVRAFLERVPDPSAAGPLDVHRFAYGPCVNGADPAPATIGIRLAAVGGFLAFAARIGAIDADPSARVARPLARPPIPRGLTRSQVRQLLDAIPPTSMGLRDTAIVLTAVLTGLRRVELAGLRLQDLEGREPILVRFRAKGGRLRRRELPRPAADAIAAALRARGAQPDENSDERLFGLSSAGLYAVVRRLGRAVGLDSLSPHVLRHTAAKLRREAGASIEDIAALLGHSSVATTAGYLARLEGERDDGWAAVSLGLGANEPPRRPFVARRRAPTRRDQEAGRRSKRSGGRINAHPTWRIGAQRRAPRPRSQSSR